MGKYLNAIMALFTKRRRLLKALDDAGAITGFPGLVQHQRLEP
jgi:hypothetical protein